jgi:hypothetical protein
MHRLKQSFKHTAPWIALEKMLLENLTIVWQTIQALHPATRYSACLQQGESLQQLKAASDRISFDRQAVNQVKEGRYLIQEQEVIRESLDRGDCAPVLCQRWPNHGTLRQTLADKFARLRQNLVGLS